LKGAQTYGNRKPGDFFMTHLRQAPTPEWNLIDAATTDRRPFGADAAFFSPQWSGVAAAVTGGQSSAHQIGRMP
jgi:hypothetical protein